MILTVTLNPALDLTYTVDRLVPHTTHRVRTIAERPGGKGINVARVLHQAGEPVLATGLLGGATGARIQALLDADGLASDFVSIAGESRRTVTVVDDIDATGLWEPGPLVNEHEWTSLVARFVALLPSARVAVLSGSLPRGLPTSAYATLIVAARERGVQTILDTSGEALRSGIAAGPDIVKPNATEFAALTASMAATTTSTTTMATAAATTTAAALTAADKSSRIDQPRPEHPAGIEALPLVNEPTTAGRSTTDHAGAQTRTIADAIDTRRHTEAGGVGLGGQPADSSTTTERRSDASCTADRNTATDSRSNTSDPNTDRRPTTDADRAVERAPNRDTTTEPPPHTSDPNTDRRPTTDADRAVERAPNRDTTTEPPPHTSDPNTDRRPTADADRAVEWALGCGVRAVVVSRGSDGLHAHTADRKWLAVSPEVVSGNSTGAGDACVAALARGLRDATPWPRVLSDAVALAAAAVAVPVAGMVDASTYERLVERIAVTALAESPDGEPGNERGVQHVPSHR